LTREYLFPFIPATAESDWNWNSFEDFMKRVEETGIGHNVAGLVGQGTIRDKATYASPNQYPEGIEMVLVNGRAVVERGEAREKKAGRALRATYNSRRKEQKI
jgi:N-acyl-D-aspartate/D-glutamate deacylase